MTQIALCDDDKFFLPRARRAIWKAAHDLDPELRIDCFTDYGMLLKGMKTEEKEYQIFFLDIDMPGINGITAGKQIRRCNKDAVIIFLSGREERVFETFACRPYSFLRKKYFSQEIRELMVSVYKYIEREAEWICISVGGIQYKWDVNKIIYVECTNRVLHIHFVDQVLDIYYKLGAMEELLSGYGFIRIHKGYLVNGRYIFCVKANLVTLENGEELPLSKYRASEVKRIFMEQLK